jgi:hypothetical protein
MKRLIVAFVAAGALFAAVPVASSADSSLPPNCWGQEHATANQTSPGIIGTYASGYAHYFHSIGLNSGQAGVPAAKAACPTPPPPPPS